MNRLQSETTWPCARCGQRRAPLHRDPSQPGNLAPRLYALCLDSTRVDLACEKARKLTAARIARAKRGRR